MEKQNPLGQRVQLSDLPTQPLKHTGLNLKYPGSGPSPVDASMPTVSAADYTEAFAPPAHSEVHAPPPAYGSGQPAPVAAPNPAFVRSSDVVVNANESPTLRKMREKFGVKQTGTKVCIASGYRWTFRVNISKIDTSWAVSTVKDMIVSGTIESTSLRMDILNTLLMCASVAAIADLEDPNPTDKPIHEHFGIHTGGYPILDPLYPPRHIRLRAASMLYDMLTDDLMASLATELEQFFGNEIDPIKEENTKSPLVPALPETS